MQYTDRITIAIPVFERKDYFDKALRSALNQTTKCEVIVVDNASSHDYFEKKCAFQNIKYYRNEKNIGMFPNWNKCFEHADTEFVMLLGDDDILKENYIETFVCALEKYQDIDVFFTNFQIYLHSNGSIQHHKHTIPFGYNSGDVVQEYGAKYGLSFPLITSAIKKDKFTGFYEEAHGSNDWHWIYGNAKNLKFYGNDKKLLDYGSHMAQDTKNISTHIKCILSIAYIYERILLPEVGKSAAHDLSLKRGKAAFDYFIAIANDKYLNTLNEEEHIYATYFREKILRNRKYYFISKLPKSIRGIRYRGLRKLKLLEKFGS